MRNNLRQILSIPALAMVTMAFSAANVDAQCPGGCFGYPAPSRPAMQSFARAPQYSSFQPAAQVFPTRTFVQTQSFVQPQPFVSAPQSFVQPQPFVSAPQFAPIETYAPVQTFAQPQPFIQPQQFAPSISLPFEQTFAAEPAIMTPMQTIDVPQYYPQSVPAALPTNTNYWPQPAIISSGQIAEPMPWNSITPTVEQFTEPSDVVEDSNSEVENSNDEQVQEGEIEGEIISPADETPGSMTPLDKPGMIRLKMT